MESASAAVEATGYVYWITVDPHVRPIPKHFEFANQSAPVVFRRLLRKGALQQEPWSGPQGVLLYRFVRR